MKRKIKIFLIIFLLLSIIAFILFLIQFEKKVMPIALNVSEKYVVLQVNKEINSVTKEIIKEMDIAQNNLFIKEKDGNNQINYLEIDTVLVNDLTSMIGERLSENLYKMRKNKIEIPVGVLSGHNFFSHLGPNLKVRVHPMGLSLVDYETSFKSVGINQINFQMWLNVECRVNAINPLYEKEFVIKRKLILINTVYSGDVPNAYLQIKDN